MFDMKRRSLWADDDHDTATHQYDYNGSFDIPEPSPRNMNLVGMYSNRMSSANPNFSDSALLDNLERGNHPAFSNNSLKRNRLSSLIPVNFFNPMRYFPQLETVYETGRESERFESRRISWMWSGKWSKLSSPKNRPPSLRPNQNIPSPLSSKSQKDDHLANLPSINETENIPSLSKNNNGNESAPPSFTGNETASPSFTENETVSPPKEIHRVPSIQLKAQSIRTGQTRPFSDTSGDTESSPSATKPVETIRKNPPSLSGWWKRLSSSLPAALLPSLLHSPPHGGVESSIQSFAESGQQQQQQKSPQGPNSNYLVAPDDHDSKKRSSRSCHRYLIAIVVCIFVLGGVGTGIAAVLTSFASGNNGIIQNAPTLSPTTSEYEEEDSTNAPTTLTPTTLTPTASPTVFTTSFPTVFVTQFPTATEFPTRSPTLEDEDEEDDD